MNVLATVISVWRRDGATDETGEPEPATTTERRARCRNCGRYYGLGEDRCPHCGSGNKIRGGAPSGQTRR